MTVRPLLYFLILAALSPLFAHTRGADTGVEFFEKRIRPALVENCYECHSAEAKKLKGKLRLDSREDILRGGETGPAIIPGNPEKSLLITAIKYTDKDLQMPPPKGDTSRKLTDNVIADFIQWIQMGAPMPEPSMAKKDSLPAKQHWAFIEPKKSGLPTISNAGWVKT